MSFEEENFAAAITYCKKALALNPTFTYCAEFLYRLVSTSGDTKEIIQNYLQRIQDNPDDKYAFFHLANLYRLHYLYEKAIFYYQESLRIDPHFHVARRNLVYCYEQLFMKYKARKIKEKIYL